MSDNLTASLSVGVIYSGDGSGLTPEQEEQLNKIPMIEQSVEEITNDLNSKANTSDIPTNTSELYNDSGFLTSIPSEYVTETEMNEAIANVSTGYATKDELNTKANISDIPTKVGELYNDSYFVTTSQLNTAISGIQNTNAATIPILPNVVLFGDSITDTKVNGEWVKQIINYAKFNSLTNYGRGYCTFTFKNDTVENTTDTSDSNIGNNVIWNQYNRMVKDINAGKIPSPDCIIILAGTNDAIQTKTIGDVDSVFNNSAQSTDVKTLTNLCASVRYVCELIMVNYPNTQIILATPLQMKDYNRTSQAILVRNAIISCANKMGIKTIDQTYESGIYAYAENVRPKFLSDGVHLTVEGGKKVAQFLAREFYNKININYYKKETEETITLSSISATFNQGSNKIYNTDSLDTLKNYLTVTATYSNNSTKTVTDYALSGTLSVGVSTITVTYSNKTATFNVTVSEVETPATTYTITNNLTNVVTNNPSASVTEGNSYVATLTANSGYTLDNVTVTMAGTNITSSCYSDGSINISNVTGNIIITASAIKTTTEEAVKYFRDELVGTFSTGTWEDSVMIPDQVIPAGRYVSFECNVVGFNGGSGTAYLAAYKLTKTGTVNGDVKTDFGFTPVYVKQVTFKKGYNKFDLDYVSNEELYFGFKTANRFFIGLNTNNSSATSTNQQFNRYFSMTNSSYIPSVGVEITNMNNNTNPGMAFDCLLTVIPS